MSPGLAVATTGASAAPANAANQESVVPPARQGLQVPAAAPPGQLVRLVLPGQ